MNESQNTLLWVAIGILFLGQGFLIYRSFMGPYAITDSFGLVQKMPADATTTEGTHTAALLPPVEIGSKILHERGTVHAVGSVLSITDTQNTQAKIAVTSQTKIFKFEGVKPQAQYQQEIDAYGQQVAELLKDREKNQAQLEQLEAPSSAILTPMSASDIKIGDEILVSYSTIRGDGTYEALRIEVTPGK